ncbi:MAG: GSCFA domain-containing protein, partial [Flavobacterium sp.]|nr:GSCFA domain-containing protein [Flavobacterium sp.]
MQFRTQISIPKSNFPIDYNSKIMSLGSCFAENISEKLDYFKFQNIVNPFGIIFNAISIERIIQRIVDQELFTENDIFYHNELWHCSEVHSSLSHPDKEQFIQNLNEILKLSHSQITKLSHFIITYGTSWVYRNLETNNIVANCHKLPQKYFKKELLTLAKTEKSIENTISLIHSINKNVKFVLTVSPVRHIKDGFVENNVSKSVLLQTIYILLQTEHYKLNIEYFCSYEIILDELRDYRFYKPDMLHPNEIAVNYVWLKFVESSISSASFFTMNQVEN